MITFTTLNRLWSILIAFSSCADSWFKSQKRLALNKKKNWTSSNNLQCKVLKIHHRFTSHQVVSHKQAPCWTSSWSIKVSVALWLFWPTRRLAPSNLKPFSYFSLTRATLKISACPKPISRRASTRLLALKPKRLRRLASRRTVKSLSWPNFTYTEFLYKWLVVRSTRSMLT